ncbi:cysteine--tRNA ligase [bacterium]|jgi:cysteinyl-tRNA synthetase|nr:cysteine--tRNA ligase [bacterium]
MSLKLYNSLSSKKEVFKSISDKKVKTYGCGPTVYNDPHIGNFRTFVFYDLLNRVLQLNGYETETAVNITDIDDKIIDRVNQENTSLKEITSKYELSFLELSKSLRILPNNHNPRATEYVEEMIEFIQALINKDLAYEMNGNIFFDIEAYPKYGKFVNISDDLEIEDNELSKKNRNDFTLWKAKKDSDGDIFWNSEWGKGRPGWHTECAVMIKTLFDGRLDIHCGGIDLKFPHHENESAQIEAIQKHNLSNYWLHAEHLNMDDEKMSKSLGNFIDVSTLIEKNGSDVVRLFLLSAHYRTKVSFSQKKLDECKKMIEKIKRFAKNFNVDSKNIELKFSSEHELFIDTLNDDLNTPGAIGVFFSFISEMNKKIAENSINDADKEKSLVFLKLFNSIFDILDFNNLHDQNIPKELQDLLVSRQEARKNLDWKLSDSIRDKIESLGWQVEDTSSGQNLSKKK